MMPFHPEPTGYTKTIFSDLQGAWQNLRDAAINMTVSDQQKRLLFHIDEAMSWENVRHLVGMQSSLLLIKNIILQMDNDDEATFWLDKVHRLLQEVMAEDKAT